MEKNKLSDNEKNVARYVSAVSFYFINLLNVWSFFMVSISKVTKITCRIKK